MLIAHSISSDPMTLWQMALFIIGPILGLVICSLCNYKFNAGVTLVDFVVIFVFCLLIGATSNPFAGLAILWMCLTLFMPAMSIIIALVKYLRKLDQQKEKARKEPAPSTR